jgi:hypothetical protein
VSTLSNPKAQVTNAALLKPGSAPAQVYLRDAAQPRLTSSEVINF